MKGSEVVSERTRMAVPTKVPNEYIVFSIFEFLVVFGEAYTGGVDHCQVAAHAIDQFCFDHSFFELYFTAYSKRNVF